MNKQINLVKAYRYSSTCEIMRGSIHFLMPIVQCFKSEIVFRIVSKPDCVLDCNRNN